MEQEPLISKSNRRDQNAPDSTQASLNTRCQGTVCNDFKDCAENIADLKKKCRSTRTDGKGVGDIGWDLHQGSHDNNTVSEVVANAGRGCDIAARKQEKDDGYGSMYNGPAIMSMDEYDLRFPDRGPGGYRVAMVTRDRDGSEVVGVISGACEGGGGYSGIRVIQPDAQWEDVNVEASGEDDTNSKWLLGNIDDSSANCGVSTEHGTRGDEDNADDDVDGRRRIRNESWRRLRDRKLPRQRARGGGDAARAAGKWPWFVWLMLKLLGMFWARPVVDKRFCHHCYKTRLDSRVRSTSSTVYANLAYLRPPEVGINNHLIDDGAPSNIVTSYSINHDVLGDEIGTTFIPGDHAREEDVGYCVNDVGDDFHYDDGRRDRCRVCDTLWWDGDGQYRKYSDESIGVKKWNHRGSGMLSLLYLVTCLALIMYDAAYYANIYWGKKKDLLRYISYMSYLIFAGSVPTLSIYGLLQSACSQPAPRFAQWPRIFDMRFVVRRLQYLNLAQRGLPKKLFLVVCVGSPCAIVVFRLNFYITVVKSTNYVHVAVTMMAAVCGLVTYGLFSYFIYLMRLSFHSQLKLDVSFIRRHVHQLDMCRARMSSSIQDFRTLQQLTSGWMVMICGTMTWSLATQVTWNYLFYKGTHCNNGYPDVQRYINGLLTAENIFFAALPFLAIGGFHVNDVWFEFRHRLLEFRRARHERFWYRLFLFFDEQDPVRSPMRVTMLFTMIGLFVALQLNDQNLIAAQDMHFNVTDSTCVDPVTTVTTTVYQ